MFRERKRNLIISFASNTNKSLSSWDSFADTGKDFLRKDNGSCKEIQNDFNEFWKIVNSNLLSARPISLWRTSCLLSENYVELKPFFTSIANSGFVVRNKGCRIPAIDPFDSAITRFIEKEKLDCEHGDYLPLVESNETALYINVEAIGHFYNNSKEIDCCWRPFWRMKDEDNVVTSVRLIILTFTDIYHSVFTPITSISRWSGFVRISAKSSSIPSFRNSCIVTHSRTLCL